MSNALSRGALCLLLLSACYQKTEEGYSEALLLFRGAREVKFTRLHGTEQVLYRVSEPFPASSVTNWIDDELAKRGWKALPNNYLNPHLANSREWSKFIDATREPNVVVRQWALDWKNSSGDVVSYGLRYSYPEHATPDLVNLEVFGVYIPAAVAERQKSVIRNFSEEQGDVSK